MEMLPYIILIVILIAGYSFVQQQRERQLTKRLKAMRDPNTVVSEVDAAITQSHQEAEFFQRNSGRR